MIGEGGFLLAVAKSNIKYRIPHILKRPPQLLLPLDRFEQGLEVTLAEAGGTFALDDFEEDRWAGLDGFGEDLE